MTESEARLLTVGTAVKDNGPGVGTVVETRLDCLSIKWTAPPERVEGVSTFLYEDCKLLVVAAPASSSVFYPDPPSGGPPNSMGNTPLVLGTKFTASAPATISKVYFWRDAADTDTSHVATVWRDQTKVAQATFPAGPATGWQAVDIGPVVMDVGVPCVVTVTHAAGSYQFFWPFPSDVTKGPITLSETGLYEASSNPNVYPSNTISGYYYGMDIG